MNEWYARDISKKIKTARLTIAKKGEFIAAYAPYGYKKDPHNKRKLIIDEETAPVVKKIFVLAASGISPFRISTILKHERILKPRAKLLETVGKYKTERVKKYPYDWGNQTIIQIIHNQAYIGNIVSNKSTTKSFKNRKLIKQPESEWIVVKNTHEAIIDEYTFELANKTAKVKRKVTKNTGMSQIFAGLLKCADCGKALSFSNRNDRIEKGSYACNTLRRFGRNYCSMHYIRFENLYEYVLADIRKHAKEVNSDPDKILEHLTQTNDIKNYKELTQTSKEMKKSEKRFAYLDTIFKNLYEDNLRGKICDERFNSLSREYEAEQNDLKTNILILKQKTDNFSDKKDISKRFIEIVAKYDSITELNAAILNELIDKIVIHERKWIDGQEHHGCRDNRHLRIQQIDIHYKFVGLI